MQQAAMNSHEGRWASLRAAAAVLFPVGILEVLALAPREQWLWPRIWLTQAVGVALVVAVVGAIAWATRGLAARLGWRWPASDVVAVLALLVVGYAHVQPLLGRWIRSRPLTLVALGLVAAVAFAGLKVISVRRRLTSREARLLLVALVALPIALTAVHRAGIFGSGVQVSPAAATAAAGLYVLAVGAVGGWGGRRRTALLAATVVLALVAVRLSVANPHQLVVLPAAGGGEDRAAAVGGPPVLLIVLDTLRADALDLADPLTSRTPQMARFARDADVYSHAIANASWSVPGHASLFTGLNVSEHRTDYTREEGFTEKLPAIVLTAQELFADHGYRTSCVSANPLISAQTGLARGFERYHSPGTAWMYAGHPLRLIDLAIAGHKARLFQILAEVSGPNLFAHAKEIVDAALAEVHGEPHALYMFLNFMDPHAPLPPAPSELFVARMSLLRARFADRGHVRSLSSHHGEVIRGRYRWRVAQMDGELGRLFDELRRRGWYEEMVIVVTADHGHALGENPSLNYWGHHSAWEPVVRIPLLIKPPGQRQGRVMTQVVQQTDVLPALLAMAGLPPREGLRSRVLEPGLELPVLTEWYPTRGGIGVPYPRLALYRDRYKFVLEGQGEREFLYDLDQSPYEEADVRSDQSELAASLRKGLDAIVERSRASMPDTAVAMDPAVEKQLRALGYVN